MKSKSLIAIVILLFIFSCESKQEKTEKEVNEFKSYADSLLNYNQYYVEVLYGDTHEINIVDPSNPALKFNNVAVQLHSNIFDTNTDYFKNNMTSAYNKYMAFELKLDTSKINMNESTLKIFDETKAKIKNISQPIK